ncbi:uncharacterized protein LOC116145002 [Pistacia vera]|uniref:uncharacterized protein LOC116145002 n=1 Tax=Pistacia vera TaxID=55513 RepID=UPI00126305EC|nr:uncharacterized protein LOC116145002 [Pistacia vera]
MDVHLRNADHSLPPSLFYDLQDCGDTSLSNWVSASPNNKPIPTTGSWSSFASSDSFLSSQVASEVGSAETESDPDEEFMAELIRQMAHFMFQDDDKLEKSWGSAGSPQSTDWSPLRMNHGRQIDISRDPSPPGPIMMEEFEKMKMNSEVPSSMSNSNVEFHSKQSLIDDQIRAIRFLKLKQEQLMKQLEYKKQLKVYQNKARAYGGYNNIGQKTVPSPTSSSISPWSNSNMQQQQQSNQQQPSSGMRAVFLGEPGSKTGSVGTGVFLPKGIGGNSSESRKKPGCSTVLIPARVVQALKQHFDKVGVPSASKFNENFPLQHDSMHVAGNGRNSFYSQQHRQPWNVPAMNHQDMGLPQEWTY